MSASATRIMAVSLHCDSAASGTDDIHGFEPIGLSDADYAYGSETPISSPSNWLVWDQLFDNHECTEKDEDSYSNPDVPPFSSSPPDFLLSSTCSSRSSGSGRTSLTSAHPESSNLSRNDSPHNGPDTPDKFIRKLHELLLIAQQEGGFVDRTDYSFYSDTSLMRTPEFSFSCDEKKEDPITVKSTSQRSNLSSLKPIQSFSKIPKQDKRPDKFSQSSSKNTSFRPLSKCSLSPVQFANRSQQTPSQEPLHQQNLNLYRIIKRAQSCLGDGISVQGEPPKKRLKQGQAADFHVRDRIYARRSASLRRADSLQSGNSDEHPTPFDLIAKQIPSIPSTPRPRNAELTAVQENTSSPVPIIAPPPDHVPNFPLSSESVAKVRIMRLLEREVSGRQADGLSPGIHKRPPHWMLPETEDANLIDIDGQSSIEDDIRFEWEVVMGLGSKRRRSIVDWLLHVLPIRLSKVLARSVSPSPPASVLSSGSSASTSSTESTQLEPEHNLFDQLENFPDTRFHAVWMFLRFFYLMMPHDMLQSNNETAKSPKTSLSHTSKTLQQDGLALVAWDVAVACLSLSVKFHRDFLNPLLPVYAHEYLTLAPHSLTHDDLESAHRDVLAAFDYRLGITPQAVMDLLWDALPSLRSLLDFDGGWQKAQQGTWSCLFDFLREPDVQRFPISVLTAVSLMNSISDCLVHQYRRESLLEDISFAEAKCSDDDIQDIRAVWDECRLQAQEDTEGVFCDIQALIGLTDVQLRDCRLWMAHID